MPRWFTHRRSHIQAVADPGIPKKGMRNRGYGGRKSPSGVPERSPGWGLGAKPPEATGIMLHSQLTTISENFNTKTYTTQQKQDKLSAKN